MTVTRFVVRCLDDDQEYESPRYATRAIAENKLAAIDQFGACNHPHAVFELVKLDCGRWVEVVEPQFNATQGVTTGCL